MIKVAVVGASGYAGGELLRIISGHPQLDLKYAIANNMSGESISRHFPNLQSIPGVFQSIEEVDFKSVDAVLLALPHGESAGISERIPDDKFVVDLGADFRLAQESDWLTFYSGNHAGHWLYGLADIPKLQSEIGQVKRVANPGCYATAINLSLAPFIDAAVIDSSRINVVAASGTSGAGRKASPSLLSAENMNNISTYKVGGIHQHIPEIEQFLSSLSSMPIRVGFTPMLAPIPRGILAVSTAPLLATHSAMELQEISRNFFGANPFIEVLAEGKILQTKAVQGTNNIKIQIHVDRRTKSANISAVIDNLVKGAAGQAIQNLNLMVGFEMSLGLTGVGIFP